MATIVQDTAGTGTILSTQFDHEVDSKKKRVYRDSKFLVASRRLSKHRSCDSIPVYWYEQDELDRWDAVQANTASATTTFSIGSIEKAVLHGIIVVKSSLEQMRIVSIGINSVVKVMRRVGGGTQKSLKAGTSIYFASRAYPDGAQLATEQWLNPTRKVNYNQFFKRAIDITRGAARSKMYTGKTKAERHVEEMFGIKKDVEGAFIFGKPATSVDADGQNVTQTGGILHWAGTTSSIKSINQAALTSYLETLCEAEGSNRKLCIASGIHLRHFDYMKSNKLIIEPSEHLLDISIGRFRTSFCEIEIINGMHVLKDGFADYMLFVDEANYEVTVFQDLGVNEDVVKDGHSGETDQWEYWCGLKMWNSNSHGYVYGTTAYKA